MRKLCLSAVVFVALVTGSACKGSRANTPTGPSASPGTVTITSAVISNQAGKFLVVTAQQDGQAGQAGRACIQIDSRIACMSARSTSPPGDRPLAMNTGSVSRKFDRRVGACACGTYIVRRGSVRKDTSRISATTPTISTRRPTSEANDLSAYTTSCLSAIRQSVRETAGEFHRTNADASDSAAIFYPNTN